MIRLILEKVELNCSPSWLVSFVQLYRDLIRLDPVVAGQFANSNCVPLLQSMIALKTGQSLDKCESDYAM
jgi:hypothetical protein